MKSGQGFKLPEWRRAEIAAVGAVLLLLALAPVVVRSPFYQNMLVMTVIYAFVAAAWNLLGGYAGQPFIGGGVTFFGIGAYTSTALLVKSGLSPWLGMLAGAAVAMVFALGVAKLTLRYSVKGDYLALFSVAVSQVLGLVATNIDWLGGAYGFNLPLKDESFLLMTWSSKLPYLYVSLGLLALLVGLTFAVEGRKMGKYWVAIRENENAAETLGVNTARYKTIAMLLCAAFGAMGGTLYAQYTTFIDPTLVFGLALNVELIMPVIVGGRGTVLGPVLGALLLKPMSEIVRAEFGSARTGLYLMIYGAMLVVFILYLPQGLTGALRQWYHRVRKGQLQVQAKGGVARDAA